MFWQLNVGQITYKFFLSFCGHRPWKEKRECRNEYPKIRKIHPFHKERSPPPFPKVFNVKNVFLDLRIPALPGQATILLKPKVITAVLFHLCSEFLFGAKLVCIIRLLLPNPFRTETFVASAMPLNHTSTKSITGIRGIESPLLQLTL